MKILAVGDPHGDLKKIKKISTKGVELILITGDLGKADFVRKFFFDNLKRKGKGLPEKEYTKIETKKVYSEVHNSTINVLKYFSKSVLTYSILGNVGVNMIKDSKVKKDEKKYRIKLSSLKKALKNLKNFYLARNVIRNVKGLRIGFLEYFLDDCWVIEFKPKDYKEKLKDAKKETAKAKRILKRFGKVDMLVCHQPPYGYLDKVSSKYNPPKKWVGKYAGSKVILDYIKKCQPKYVFCGHIHEGEGKAKIGKSEIYNLGVAGHKLIELSSK